MDLFWKPSIGDSNFEREHRLLRKVIDRAAPEPSDEPLELPELSEKLKEQQEARNKHIEALFSIIKQEPGVDEDAARAEFIEMLQPWHPLYEETMRNLKQAKDVDIKDDIGRTIDDLKAVAEQIYASGKELIKNAPEEHRLIAEFNAEQQKLEDVREAEKREAAISRKREQLNKIKQERLELERKQKARLEKEKLDAKKLKPEYMDRVRKIGEMSAAGEIDSEEAKSMLQEFARENVDHENLEQYLQMLRYGIRYRPYEAPTGIPKPGKVRLRYNSAMGTKYWQVCSESTEEGKGKWDFYAWGRSMKGEKRIHKKMVEKIRAEEAKEAAKHARYRASIRRQARRETPWGQRQARREWRQRELARIEREQGPAPRVGYGTWGSVEAIERGAIVCAGAAQRRQGFNFERMAKNDTKKTKEFYRELLGMYGKDYVRFKNGNVQVAGVGTFSLGTTYEAKERRVGFGGVRKRKIDEAVRRVYFTPLRGTEARKLSSREEAKKIIEKKLGEPPTIQEKIRRELAGKARSSGRRGTEAAPEALPGVIHTEVRAITPMNIKRPIRIRLPHEFIVGVNKDVEIRFRPDYTSRNLTARLKSYMEQAGVDLREIYNTEGRRQSWNRLEIDFKKRGRFSIDGERVNDVWKEPEDYKKGDFDPVPIVDNKVNISFISADGKYITLTKDLRDNSWAGPPGMTKQTAEDIAADLGITTTSEGDKHVVVNMSSPQGKEFQVQGKGFITDFEGDVHSINRLGYKVLYKREVPEGTQEIKIRHIGKRDRKALENKKYDSLGSAYTISFPISELEKEETWHGLRGISVHRDTAGKLSIEFHETGTFLLFKSSDKDHSINFWGPPFTVGKKVQPPRQKEKPS